MARTLTMALIVALLGGCVIVPDYGYRGGGYHHGYSWGGRGDGYRGWDGRR